MGFARTVAVAWIAPLLAVGCLASVQPALAQPAPITPPAVAPQGGTPQTELPKTELPKIDDPGQLITVLQSATVANGIATTRDGRTFLPFSRIDGSTGPQVVEWTGGKPVPFPDATWNGWKAGDDPAKAFVRVNALRIGPRGALWIVDVGAPGLGNPKLPHGPKIVKIDLKTNTIARIYDLEAATSDKSFIDDIRFHGHNAYITDAGAPGVIVLDTQTGETRRVLDGDPSMTAQRPLTAEDHVLRGPDGKPVRIHADQLEVSPDGRFFYYQPASGPMSRIATRYLDDPKLTSPQLAKHVTTFAKTPSTGGTAIDADGNLYVSDTDRQRVLKLHPDGTEEVLVQDARLVWVDAMWIDQAGYLFMPAAQLDRMAPFNNGVDKVQYPISVYKTKIGIGPPAADHP